MQNISEFCENWIIFKLLRAETNIHTDRQTLHSRMTTKLIIVLKWKGDLSNYEKLRQNRSILLKVICDIKEQLEKNLKKKKSLKN